MKTQIPLFRAKKLDSDEYVEGALIPNAFFMRETKEPCCYIFDNSKMDYDCFVDIGEQLDDFEIDPSTLAIHFPEVKVKDLFFGIDNYKGASQIEALFENDSTPFKGVAMHTSYGYIFYDKNDDWVHISKLKDIKVTGIQE